MMSELILKHIQLGEHVSCKKEDCGRNAVFVLKHKSEFRSIHGKQYWVCQRHGPRDWMDPSILLRLGSRVKLENGEFLMDQEGYPVVVYGLEHIMKKMKGRRRRKKGEKKCDGCGKWKEITNNVYENGKIHRYCIECYESR